MKRERSTLLWVIYAVAWLLFAMVQFAAIRAAITASLPEVILSTVSLTVPGAVLGLLVVWVSARLDFGKGRVVLLSQHILLSIAYAGGWLGSLYLEMAHSIGWEGAWRQIRTFLMYQTFNGFVAYVIIASVTHTIKTWTRFSEEENRAQRAETLRARAELEALRGKLQPHFLFNTLHGITALVREDPERAEQALLKLGSMLRYVLTMKCEEGPDDVSVADEISFVEQYLALEKIRLGERLRFSIDITEAALTCVLPAFTLQPLVENAVQHAIAPRAQGGILAIAGEVVAGQLKLIVQDDGPGTQVKLINNSPGIGLKTIRQRVLTRFPAKSSVEVNTAPDQGFTVTLTLPAEEASEV